MNANGFKEASMVLAPAGEHSTPSLKLPEQAGRDDVITLSFEFKWPDQLTGSSAGTPQTRAAAGGALSERPWAIRNPYQLPSLVVSVHSGGSQCETVIAGPAPEWARKDANEAPARLLLMVNRAKPADMPAVFSGGDLHIDFEQCQVKLKGQTVKLTPTEYKMLVVLARNANKMVTRESLLEEVWGAQYRDAVAYLKSHIHYLRLKLGDNGNNPKLILNERGLGYRLAIDHDKCAENAQAAPRLGGSLVA